MARIVRRTPQEPTKYVIDGKEVWLCKCGLSKNQPYCDGSHKITKGEEGGKLYWYDDAGQRHEVADGLHGIPTFLPSRASAPRTRAARAESISPAVTAKGRVRRARV